MNCDECKLLISDFMNDDLSGELSPSVRDHLALCTDCSLVCEDFASILDVCNAEAPSGLVPPNSQALWCRINNIIESEVKPVPEPQQARGFWRFSFGQLAAALMCVAVVSSLLTVIALRNYTQPREATDLSTSSSQSSFQKVMSRIGLVDTPEQARDRRFKEQQAAIEYWNARVQARRAQWDHSTRDAFDRNLQAIDDSVNEYTMILQQDPSDELSGEMLDAVLTDKMNLLRDFSDL